MYASEDAMLLGTARVMAGELIPGRLLSPIEIEQMRSVEPNVTDAGTTACAERAVLN